MTEKKSEISLLKDRDWDVVDSELCLVEEFKPLMGNVVRDGIVIAPDTTTPYASIIIKSRKTTEKITGFITHKIDFFNLWSALEERGTDKEREEVLIYWTTKRYRYKIQQILSNFLMILIGSTPFPKVIVAICPKGTYKTCEGYPNGFRLTPDKEILVFIYGLLSIKWWVPEVIK